MKSIAVIVLTWNDWKNTINCLETIYGNDYSKFDIIIVNNNSTYNHISKIINWSKNKILPDDPHIKVNKIKKIKIRNILASAKINKIGQKNIFLINSNKININERWAVNLGCTAGLNIGYKFAANNNYDLVARIDCDFTVGKDYLRKMINFFSNKNPVAASPKIKHGIYRNTVWWQGFIKDWKYLKFQRTMNLKKKRITDLTKKGLAITDAVCGCCSIYNTYFLKKVGFGDEEFFFGPEDMELSYRLKKYGDLMVNLDVVTYHKVAKSALITGMNKRKYYETKGFLIFIKKTGNFLDKFVGYSYFLIRIPYHLVKKNYGYILGCYDFFFKKL